MNKTKRNIAAYFWIFFGFGLCFSCDQSSSVYLETQKAHLDYSVYFVPLFDNMGLVDMTDLDEKIKADIAAIDIRYAQIPSSNFNGQIVILDANRNGKFEYDSLDIIGLTSFKRKLQFEFLHYQQSFQPIGISIEDEKYSILINEDGRSIELSRIDNDDLQSEFIYPFQIPNLKVKKLTKNASLNKENGKYTYVEFWGTWCKPCIRLIPEIRTLKSDFADKLNIISVDYGDNDLDRVRKYIKQYKMNWDHIVADEALMNEFANPHSFPCGVLFDPDGYLVEYGIKPGNVRHLLEGLQ